MHSLLEEKVTGEKSCPGSTWPALYGDTGLQGKVRRKARFALSEFAVGSSGIVLPRLQWKAAALGERAA